MRSGPRRYKILHPVGKGAFGTVYRAQMTGEGGFHKDVALKLMNADVEQAEEVAQRQRDEARLLGLIRHRAILQVDGLVRLNGHWAVVMEYIDGVNLRELLRFGPTPPGCALSIVCEVAGALAAAWDATDHEDRPLRIIHRDIKPPNIQLTAQGEVKLLDFGVARAEFDTRESSTVGMMLGTLRYMAPERLDGVDTPAGDIYALGIVLVELLTRKPMLKTSSNPKRHDATVEEAMTRLRDALGENHEPLFDLIRSCLAYDPEGRPSARKLERKGSALVRDYPEPRLQEWSRLRVREAQDQLKASLGSDGLTGETLMEQTGSVALDLSESRSLARTEMATRALGFTTILVAIGGVFLVGGTLLLGVLLLYVVPNDAAKSVAAPSSPPIALIPDGDSLPAPRWRERGAPEPAPPPPAVPSAPQHPYVEFYGATPTSPVVLQGDNGRFTVPSRVPPGVYDVVFKGAVTIPGFVVGKTRAPKIKCADVMGNCAQK